MYDGEVLVRGTSETRETVLPDFHDQMPATARLRHFEFNQARPYAYEQPFLTIREIHLSMAAVDEKFRRMAFNIIGLNQDDHAKTIALLPYL